MGKVKYTEDYIRNVANARGGKLINLYYIIDTPRNKLRATLECEYGHTWITNPTRIDTKWCPDCNPYKKLTQKHADNLALKKGGKCLSIYVNARTPMTWQCGIGHKWKATYDNVSRQTWCPTCNCTNIPTQSDAEQMAIKYGGECVSKYLNSETKLRWKCAKGHEWDALYGNILKGSWCPKCRNKTEQYCRSIFECLFKKEFPYT